MSRQLHLIEPAHLDLAAERIAAGAIVVAGFNGIFVLLGDADDSDVGAKIAAAKGRPRDQRLALVCSPEHLHEHVDITSAVLREHHSFETIMRLYRTAHAIGAILPASATAPPHIVQAGTVLNVWAEYPPHQPIRQLIARLRDQGKRTLAGTSANKTGQPTYTDPQQVCEMFESDVELLLLDRFDGLSPALRRSTSIVDFTAPVARLHREGSLPAEELRALFTSLGLGALEVGPDVLKVVTSSRLE